ncbi:MAG TPA: hypothetical protein VN698_07030 [Bacteroidia bacterium]|nr:hypothetical protein [Bacteroidia bacterium]
MADNQRDQILKMLREKSVMKQDVYKNTQNTFDVLKDVVKTIAEDLRREVSQIDRRITIEFRFPSDHEIELKVAGDMLVFYMHSNVFEFDKAHPMFKTGYIKQNELNSYCGIIYVYNFLADSFKYNRLQDLGYLISRLFINRENRFFLEAKPPLGYKYSNFSDTEISSDTLKEIVYDLIAYAISFDLYTPPADNVREISLNEIIERVQSDKLKTGKRLGFKSQTDGNIGDEIAW